MGILIISVSQSSVLQAEMAIEGCIYCIDGAAIPFWQILHNLRTPGPERVQYLLPVLGRCPICKALLDESTLVVPKRQLQRRPDF